MFRWNILRLLLLFIFFSWYHSVFANNYCCVSMFKEDCCPCAHPCPWYVLAGVGDSRSRKANITVDPNIWDFAQQGYDNNLSNTALWYAGLGYNFCHFLRFDVNGAYRGDYKYSKFQTGTSGTPGFTGNARTRKFKLDSNSVMFSAWLDGDKISHSLKWGSHCFYVTPFIGGGIGVDYLKLHDFHTIGDPFIDSTGNVRNDIPSVNAYTTNSQFAWHAAAGLAARLMSKTTIEVGYNYFDGGELPFPDYIGGTTSTARRFASVTPWHGRLRSNEVFAELQVSL